MKFHTYFWLKLKLTLRGNFLLQKVFSENKTLIKLKFSYTDLVFLSIKIIKS